MIFWVWLIGLPFAIATLYDYDVGDGPGDRVTASIVLGAVWPGLLLLAVGYVTRIWMPFVLLGRGVWYVLTAPRHLIDLIDRVEEQRKLPKASVVKSEERT